MDKKLIDQILNWIYQFDVLHRNNDDDGDKLFFWDGCVKNS